MKILAADKTEQWGLDQLKGVADALEYDASLKDDALKQKLADFDPDVVIVRSTKLPADVLAAGKSLKLIIRAGSGFDTIDIDAAAKRNIRVCNCPGMNAIAVAELTLGLLISMDRRIPDNVIDLRNHKWRKKHYSKLGRGLKGRTLGILGAGRIGYEVAKRALACEMNVLYYHIGRQIHLVDYINAQRAELDTLLTQSDVVSIHVPGGAATRRLLDQDRIATMKDGAMLINTSRADVVDEEALIAALKSGKLGGAAIDVYANEPAADAETIDSPVVTAPNLYGTHHIGASTEQAQLAVAEETVRIVTHFKQSGEALNCVNAPQKMSNPLLIVTMDNQPGSIGAVLQLLGTAKINALEFDQVVYDSGQAACAHLRIDQQPSEELLAKIRGANAIRGVDLLNAP